MAAPGQFGDRGAVVRVDGRCAGGDREREQHDLAARELGHTSGPPPPETLAGAPLHPWTIPNAIGYVRLALIPVFLALALSSDNGTDALPVVIFAVIFGAFSIVI